MFKVGIGYDVHRFAEGRKLILGGVEIPFEKGLLGHSDADVLVHAIIDAILGAMGENDIGRLFPDSSPKYKDISSLLLLKEVAKLLEEKNLKIVNIDSTIVSQRPKISPYTNEMKNKIADCLKIESTQVNIKGKTTEGLGFEGREEGISAYAVVLICE
ncbi:2C-methyl-D-erythritol 2,4-cyclodiphosphate synthase [Caldicellulosiruptor acetigenus I77R1B]|jgi:2-C-methyl-D-erythritol 2,4-cyclodiphosphate synthase|uniref:2-C-methyl-D-erythritol 2,4-cyclodiphosphate synthase n=2 Tax=Caldicellulosiruptor acetigenus TaxID=301953 RepID=G2PYY1_9FIRM|nr:2-C-methyl-D-erythritol 2,4-cyclodiphosphate synthase [Caldicellulosiruptor acetigenus]ADQ40628.1 2C-methyl-D-erythritol 2,4-cyclodiphosphate synthase [Caldicellulosiruptor acetigenus I77R1B]AEM73202.1 2-C-methyl-D-erythritol 2,4-cyclodiphosphate synthase [Caldicellulosiruptor acetigenus 6A]WAM35278.1 2-C-methyl-D-erythritol 2,4-cyclodiphosphate synthase [Caldicellulosiruptor acetigenus]